MRPCNSKVEDKDNPSIVTYCPLPSGHKGICVPDRQAHTRIIIRCQSISPDGIQCGMPEHPDSLRHQNGLRTWSGDYKKPLDKVSG